MRSGSASWRGSATERTSTIMTRLRRRPGPACLWSRDASWSSSRPTRARTSRESRHASSPNLVFAFCGVPRGQRSSLPLVVQSFDSTAEGASTASVPYPSPPYLPLVSEKFLRDPHAGRTTWVRVAAGDRHPRTSAQDILEAIPKSLVPYVPVKGLHKPLITCHRCRRPRSLAVTPPGSNLWHFVCSETFRDLCPGSSPRGHPELRAVHAAQALGGAPAPTGREGLARRVSRRGPDAHMSKRPARKLLSRQRKDEERGIRRLGL